MSSRELAAALPPHVPIPFSLGHDGAEHPLVIVGGDQAGPSLVVFPSAFGIADDLVAQLIELSAHAGLVVAFDPFGRVGPGVIPYDQVPRMMERLGALDRARALADWLAIIEWTRARRPGAPVLGLGICLGGPMALLAAAEGRLDGVVGWHGSRIEQFLARITQAACPITLHFGERDPISPPAAIEAIRAAFAGRTDVEIEVHPDATHGYSHRSHAGAYDPAAEAAGLAAVVALARRLGARPPA